MHGGKRGRRNHLLQHLDRVVLDEAQVGELLLIDALQQRADAGLVDFDAEEVFVRPCRGDRRRRLAHAEADLDDERRVAAEDARCIERCCAERHDVARRQFTQRAHLPGAHASGTQHVALDAASRRGGRVGRSTHGRPHCRVRP
jgi:hypothetical protein